MPDPPRRIVSACLAGQACRWDGRAKTREDVRRDVAGGHALAVCPELLGGLGSPRRPAEIVGGDGEDVLDGRARVIDDEGRDVTAAYVAGARQVLQMATDAGISEALLKERSPSCGSAETYDGTFRGRRRAGSGVTAALLRRAGIRVRSDES